MNLIQILAVILIGVSSQPILTLPLSLSANRSIETTFGIGNSDVRLNIDIGYNQIDICCKNKNSLLKTIYYFMLNPFNQKQEYYCKNQTANSQEVDTAFFQTIGPVEINFNQVIYPSCAVGRMGFNPQSVFLSLMPNNNRFCIFSRQENLGSSRGFHWKMVIGGIVENDFTYFETNKADSWSVNASKISFNNIAFEGQTITFVSNAYLLSVPNRIYNFIKNDLINNFKCTTKYNEIYCPCMAGISPSFPELTLHLKSQLSFSILPASYLSQQNEICSTFLRQSPHDGWQLNFLLLDNTDLLFDFDLKRVGLARRRSSIQTTELVNKPLQILLNSVVILILCFFIAMVLIELIKYFTGLEEASKDSFQTYMLKHAE